ncbi:MAG: metallophosphoesterase family protein [Bdellovibrionota bacterium]
MFRLFKIKSPFFFLPLLFLAPLTACEHPFSGAFPTTPSTPTPAESEASSATPAAAAATQVVVLGDSRGDAPTGVNEQELRALNARIAPIRPSAVFFTGDLVLGLEKEEDDDHDPSDLHADAPGHWKKTGYIYSSKVFARQLDGFAKIMKDGLGAIPFYPGIGNHDAIGPDAVKTFRAKFPPPNAAPLDGAHLAYSVDVGSAHFVMLATDYYDGGLQEHELSDGEMTWLAQDLHAHASSAFKFVLGHEPAFTSKAVVATGKTAGLDQHPKARDRFWATLQTNGVTAYLCAHEHLYERSFHDGVWQVISGGAGAPLSSDIDTFYHFLSLTIPAQAGASAHVSVIDDQGKVRDDFDLAPQDGTRGPSSVWRAVKRWIRR